MARGLCADLSAVVVAGAASTEKDWTAMSTDSTGKLVKNNLGVPMVRHSICYNYHQHTDHPMMCFLLGVRT